VSVHAAGGELLCERSFIVSLRAFRAINPLAA